MTKNKKNKKPPIDKYVLCFNELANATNHRDKIEAAYKLTYYWKGEQEGIDNLNAYIQELKDERTYYDVKQYTYEKLEPTPRGEDVRRGPFLLEVIVDFDEAVNFLRNKTKFLYGREYRHYLKIDPSPQQEYLMHHGPKLHREVKELLENYDGHFLKDHKFISCFGNLHPHPERHIFPHAYVLEDTLFYCNKRGAFFMEIRREFSRTIL